MLSNIAIIGKRISNVFNKKLQITAPYFHHRSFPDPLCSDASDRGYPTLLPGACDRTAFAERFGRLVEPGLPLPTGSGTGFRCSLFQCGALLQHNYGVVHNLSGPEFPVSLAVVRVSSYGGF